MSITEKLSAYNNHLLYDEKLRFENALELYKRGLITRDEYEYEEDLYIDFMCKENDYTQTCDFSFYM